MVRAGEMTKTVLHFQKLKHSRADLTLYLSLSKYIYYVKINRTIPNLVIYSPVYIEYGI